MVVVMGLTNKQRVQRKKKPRTCAFSSHVSLSTARSYFVSNGVVYYDDHYSYGLKKAHMTLEQFLGNPSILTNAEFKQLDGKVA